MQRIIHPYISNQQENNYFRKVFIPDFLSIKNLITRQHGSFLGRFTVLFYFSMLTMPSLNSMNKHIHVITDFSKAFKTADHTILIRKPSWHGIIGLAPKWLRSFITGQNLHKKVNGFITNGCKVGHVRHSPRITLGSYPLHVFINDVITN